VRSTGSVDTLESIMKPFPAVASFAALVTFAPSAFAQQFVYNPAALPAQNVWTDGVVLVDVDGDGDRDIAFANGSAYGGTGTAGAQPQHLFLNNGAGVFSAAHAQLNVANFNAKMVIAEDFDLDGDPDLMYASGSTGSPPRILINNGSGTFSDQTATRIPVFAANPRSFCVCAGDVDDDGDLDVVVTDGGTFGGVASQAILLLNDGSGVFTNATTTHLPVDLYNAQDVTLFDFDADNDIDIALSGKGATGKRGRLYVNDGTGHFGIGTAMDAVGTSATYEIDWCELDRDADLDALVQSISGFSEGWARNDGVSSPMVTAVFPAPNGSDDNEMAGLDYDNDGRVDVLVGSLGATERLYRSVSIGVFVNDDAAIQAQADSTLDLAIGDLNGDGRHDFVTAQGESGNFTDKVYMNNGPADTIAPRFLRRPKPALANPVTVFHCQVQDAICDDGTAPNYSVVYSYTTTDGGGGTVGGGAGFHQGGGLWRAAVPSPAGTTSITISWIATDENGNASSLAFTIP
jgi:hypothetical protein